MRIVSGASTGRLALGVDVSTYQATVDWKRMGDSVDLIFPRGRGHSDYAASAAICDLNSNSMGLT